MQITRACQPSSSKEAKLRYDVLQVRLQLLREFHQEPLPSSTALLQQLPLPLPSVEADVWNLPLADVHGYSAWAADLPSQQEQEKKEREAATAKGGWTVVVHHKGRKKTTDAETGTAVGSVSLVAMQEKMAQKKPMEVGLNFYRHQKREAHMTELAMLQSKFEQDKKRIQQLPVQRKFKPY